MSSKAQIFEALLVSQRSGGVTLAGGKVYFYVPGAETLKAVYQDRNKTTPAANPFTLSADGTAMLYGDGLYDVKVSDASNVQKFFWEDVLLLDGAPESQLFSSDFTSDLSATIATIGSTPATLIVNNAQTVSANLTTPPTLAIRVEKPGLITIASGKTLAINGAFSAGLCQCFDGAGIVAFGSGSIIEAYPEWWGAAVDQQSSGFDSGPAIRKAVAAVGVPKLVFANGTYNIGMIDSSGTTYKIADAVTTKFGFVTSKNIILQGSGKFKSYVTAQDSTHEKTQFHFTGVDATSVGMYINDINVEAKNIEFYMDAVTAGAIAIKGYGRYNTIKDCAFRADKGVHFTYVMNTIIEDNKFYVSTEGVRLDLGTTFSIVRNYVAGSNAAGSKGIVLGDPTKVTPSGDSTILSGTATENIIEGFDYGYYLDPAHGILSGAWSAGTWNASQIVLSNNYYEDIAVNFLWAKDAHLVSINDVNSQSTGGAFNITWDKVNANYRYATISGNRIIPTQQGLVIGATVGGADTDADFGTVIVKSTTIGVPKVRVLSTGTGAGTRISEMELRDKNSDYGYIARYNRDNVSVYGANVSAALHIVPIAAGVEGTPVATFAQAYTAITNQVVATASLPAASTAMNGRILIEDAGAGNRNLIIYGGGERFRIDGGAAF